MAADFLIISNPPHASEADFINSARLFGLSAAEVRVKANYPAPQIWLTAPDRQTADEKVRLLAGAGLRAKVVGASVPPKLPSQKVVSDIGFEGGRITFSLGTTTGSLTQDARMLAVYCKPKEVTKIPKADLSSGKKGFIKAMRTAGETREMGLAGFAPKEYKDGDGKFDAGGPDNDSRLSIFLDIFFVKDKGLSRITILEGHTRFSGLGEDKKDTFKENLEVVVSRLKNDFSEAMVDTRLVEAVIKDYPVGLVPLDNILKDIAPRFNKTGRSDLASRLVFTTYMK